MGMSKLSDTTTLAEVRLTDDEWDGTSWVPAGTLAKRAAHKDRRERELRFAASGCSVTDDVLEAMRSETLLETESTLKIAAWWEKRIQRGAKPWLVLSGATGCGKTVAVGHLLWTLGGRLVRADELVRMFASMFGDQHEQQQKVRDEHTLVIDDVGGELDEKRMLPALLDLLDSRKSARSRPTIVTTNLSKKDFASRYANERLMSRMAELVHWEAVGGGDLRKRKP
jgi:DNA replication protein DnaC